MGYNPAINLLIVKEYLEVLQKKSYKLVLIGLSLANLLGCLDLTSVSTALPYIKQHFLLTNAQLQWVTTILLLALATFMVVMGKLADQYGRRLLLYVGFLLLFFSSLFAGISENFYLLLFFRFLQGIAIAILYTAPVAIIPELFGENTGKAMGILYGVSGIGLTLGPIIGGFLTQLYSWHAIFFINMPIIVIAFAFCFFQLPESKKELHEKVDLLGSLFLILGLGFLVYILTNIQEMTWLSFKTLFLILLSIIFITCFIVREKTTKDSLISIKLFKNTRFVSAAMVNFFLAFFYAVDLFFIPLHLHATDHLSSEKIGLFLMSSTIMVAIFSPLSGFLYNFFGAKKLLSIGCMLLIISGLLQAYIHSTTYLTVLILPYVLFGIGWAFILSPSITTAMMSVEENMGGVAIGSIGVLHNIGGVIGIAIAASMSFYNAMWLIISISILSFLFVMFGISKK